jgi:hypothetical protein
MCGVCGVMSEVSGEVRGGVMVKERGIIEGVIIDVRYVVEEVLPSRIMIEKRRWTW